LTGPRIWRRMAWSLPGWPGSTGTPALPAIPGWLPTPGLPEGEVWWVALAGEGVTWLPHNLRHALITAVARRALGASPEGWDNLVVWDSRRTPRGRRWARDRD
jgi:hypothetical protein